jgi:hypothetical protein
LKCKVAELNPLGTLLECLEEQRVFVAEGLPD